VREGRGGVEARLQRHSHTIIITPLMLLPSLQEANDYYTWRIRNFYDTTIGNERTTKCMYAYA
jgi:hypothetical protein